MSPARRRFGGWLALLVLIITALIAPTYAASPTRTSLQPAQELQPAAFLPLIVRPSDGSTPFDPQQSAFSFENYSNRQGYSNMLPADVRRMFGDAVCAAVNGGT